MKNDDNEKSYFEKYFGYLIFFGAIFIFVIYIYWGINQPNPTMTPEQERDYYQYGPIGNNRWGQ